MERKLTNEQKQQIFDEYFDGVMTQTQLAEKYGVSIGLISQIVNNGKWFSKYEKKLNARKNRMKIRADMAALKLLENSTMAAEQVIKIANQSVETTPIQYQYVIQNASTAILDRAGVKPAETESKEVHVYLEGGEIDLGTPDDK